MEHLRDLVGGLAERDDGADVRRHARPAGRGRAPCCARRPAARRRGSRGWPWPRRGASWPWSRRTTRPRRPSATSSIRWCGAVEAGQRRRRRRRRVATSASSTPAAAASASVTSWGRARRSVGHARPAAPGVRGAGRRRRGSRRRRAERDVAARGDGEVGHDDRVVGVADGRVGRLLVVPDAGLGLLVAVHRACQSRWSGARLSHTAASGRKRSVKARRKLDALDHEGVDVEVEGARRAAARCCRRPRRAVRWPRPWPSPAASSSSCRRCR